MDFFFLFISLLDFECLRAVGRPLVAMDDSSASSAVAGKEETLPSTTSSDSTNINQTELSNFILECRPTLLQSRCWRNFKIDAKFLPSKNYQLRNLLSACLTSSAFSYRMTCTCGRALLIYTVSILPQQRDSLSLSCCALSLLYEPYQFLIGRLFRPWAQPWFSRRKKAGMEISLSLSVGDFFTYSGEKVEREKKTTSDVARVCQPNYAETYPADDAGE